MTVDVNAIQIEPSRKVLLTDEFQKPYFAQIKLFLQQEKAAGKTIFPEGKNIFNAFNSTPFDQVKVVILGQDPYHGTGEAHGLCFSVQDGIRIPPSLQNIYKELQNDVGTTIPTTGNLTPRTKQGVFLLNASLTVRKDQANSHKNIGRQTFTDAIIKKLSDEKDHLVFILRGAFAQQKETLIDKTKHLIIKSAHPSPFSADRGFFGSKPFSKTNARLAERGLGEINWQI
ncbi:MAG: uracil-DNA glycosylase [Candidatus Peribacteria bacterium]|nr:uracil-DNA glycosylase [Candidatus Peribacteria bacterium]